MVAFAFAVAFVFYGKVFADDFLAGVVAKLRHSFMACTAYMDE